MALLTPAAVRGTVLNKLLPPVVALVVLLVAWELAVRLSGADPTLFVPPSAIAGRLDEVRDPLYLESLVETMKLLGIGFAVSLVLGVLVGFVVARYDLLDRALTPWINGAYAAPLPAIVPLITAAVGYALSAKLVVVVSLGVFPILINTYQGVRETDGQLLEVARAFRSGELATWKNVLFPGALPFILVGVRLGVVRCLIGTVVAEFYISQGGLGYLILVFSRRFDMAATFVPVLTLTVLGLLLVGVTALLERLLTPWHER